MNLRISQCQQTRRSALCDAVSGVQQDDSCVAARHQPSQLQLQTAVRQRHCKEGVAFTEFTGFAHVKQGDFAPVIEPLAQRAGADSRNGD